MHTAGTLLVRIGLEWYTQDNVSCRRAFEYIDESKIFCEELTIHFNLFKTICYVFVIFSKKITEK